MLLIFLLYWLSPLLSFGNLAPATTPGLDVTRVGVVADGTTLQTARLQALLDSLGEAGGGTLYFPPGRYLTGSLTLHSHIGLHLAAGAVLLGSDRFADYTRPHLLYAQGAEGISLLGPGRIDGQGEAFWDEAHQPLPRPTPWILFENCRHLRIRDIQLVASPAHTLVLKSCRWAVIEGVHIDNPLYGPNTDGIDLTSSQDIHISHTYISTGDDAICLKGQADGPVSHVIVTNCILISDDAAIKCGTGSASDVRHCQFSQIQIRDTRYGIAFFMTQGAAYEHLSFSQIHIQTASRHRTEYPLYMDIDRRDAEASLGRIAHIRLQDITVETRGNCLLAGHPQAPLQDLTLDGLTLHVSDPVDLAGLRKPRGNKKFVAQSGSVDYAAVPAHLTIAHCDGLRVRDLRVVAAPDETPARHDLYLREVRDFELRELALAPGGLAAIALSYCNRGLISRVQPRPSDDLGFWEEGSSGIMVDVEPLRSATPGGPDAEGIPVPHEGVPLDPRDE